MIKFNVVNNGLTIEQLEKLQQYLDNNSLNDFFRIDEDITITVLIKETLDKMWDELEDKSKFGEKSCLTGYINIDEKTIYVLNFNDYKSGLHASDSFEDFMKISIHEAAHILNCIVMENDDNFHRCLWEGLAIYLSNQYNGYMYGLKLEDYDIDCILDDENYNYDYRSYKLLFEKMIDVYGIDKMREIITFDKDYLDLIKDVYEVSKSR